ncbi:MAG: XTP/dITP diphosphatase [bacterium]
MSRLVFATRNRGKVVELERMLAGLGVVIDDLSTHPEVEEIEETGETFRDNAILKATTVAARTGLVALADDSGLEVDGLGGRPGVRSARYAGEGASDDANNARLVAEVTPLASHLRTARYRCAIAVATPGGDVEVEEASVEGVIVTAPRGSRGFGYDPYFWVPELGRTMAELDAHEKDGISHRGRALRKARVHVDRCLAIATRHEPHGR